MPKCFGQDFSPSRDFEISYAKMPIPSTAEWDALKKFAHAHGVEWESIRKGINTGDVKAWTALFGLSLQFTRFDRNAQIYGGQLFGLFFYLVAGESEAKFMELLDAQTPRVRQRVRDFLYYSTVNPDLEVAASNGRKLRDRLKLVFPEDYKFSSEFFVSRREGQKK